MKKIAFLLILFVGVQLQAQVSLDEALDFQGKTPDGTTIDLFSHLDAGQYVMIYFFSDACYTCHEYAPSMDTIYDLYGQNQEGLYVMAVNKDVDNEAVTIFANEYFWEFPYISGTEGNGFTIFHDIYGVEMTPTTVIIKPNHDIPWDIIYPPQVDTLQKYLAVSGLFPTKIREKKDVLNLQIFPNPTHDSFQLESADYWQNLKVYNMLGEVMINKKGFSKHLIIDVKEWDKGIYLLQLNNEQTLINRRLVVE